MTRPVSTRVRAATAIRAKTSAKDGVETDVRAAEVAVRAVAAAA